MVMFFQILCCLVLVGLGGFFSGSETGIYCLSRFKLRLGIERGERSCDLLGKMMEDSHGLMFSMLMGTNLVNYLVTSIVTVMFLRVSQSEHSAEVYATLLVAPVLFTFSEVVPKNIYYHKSDVLMPRLACLLWVFHKIFTFSGVVAGLTLISRYLSRMMGDEAIGEVRGITRGRGGYLQEIIRETHDEGVLSSVQNEIMSRLVSSRDIPLRSVMVGIGDVEMLGIQSDLAAVKGALVKHGYSRVPVYAVTRNNVKGFVNIYEICRVGGDFTDIEKFRKPIVSLNESMSVADALNTMRRENLNIVMVSRGYGARQRNIGMVTIKDLVEELVGELAQW